MRLNALNRINSLNSFGAKKSGISWSSYWTPSNYVVENADPDALIVTYAKKPNPAEMIVGNFAVSGNTISSITADGTGFIFTFALGTALIYGDAPTLTTNGQIYNITNNVALDVNAAAFLTAQNNTDETQKKAVNRFVLDLKAINSIDAGFVDFGTPANSKLKACYPFVGGTNDKHKWNLINPQDTNGAFRLTYAGVISSDAQGLKSDGVLTSYTNTFFATNNWDVTNYGFDLYVSVMPKPASAVTDIGVNDGTVTFMYNADQPNYQTKLYNAPTQILIAPPATTVDNYLNKVGLHCFNKKSNADGADVYINGMLRYDGGAINNATFGTTGISIFKMHGANAGNRTLGYLAFRTSLSDTALTAYMTAVQRLMDSLGRGFRNVRILGEGHSQMQQSDVIREVYNDFSGNSSYRIKKYVNSATAGLQCQQLSGRISTTVTPFYESGYINIAIIWCGTNDLSTIGANIATETFNEINSYNEELIALGWKTIILTCTPRYHATNQSGFDTQRSAFNTLLKTNMNALTTVVDLDLCTELADFNNTTYYSDKLHTTAAGADVVAGAVVPAIKALLA